MGWTTTAPNGRKVTTAADDRQPQRELALSAAAHDNLYMSMGWLDGKSSDGTVEFDLSCGAGIGGRQLSLQVTHTAADGTKTTRNEVVDVGTLAQSWVKAIVADIEGGTLAPLVFVDADNPETVVDPETGEVA